MEKVIVTGANGFVGYWLIRELCKNDVKVTAIIKDTNENISMLSEFKGVDIVYCGLAELDTLKENGYNITYKTNDLHSIKEENNITVKEDSIKVKRMD